MLLSPRSGYINQFFMDLGFDGPIFNIYSYAGIMAVETMYLFPFVFYPSLWCIGAHGPYIRRISENLRRKPIYHYPQNYHSTVMPSILSGALLIMPLFYGSLWYCCRTGRRNGILTFQPSFMNVFTKVRVVLKPFVPVLYFATVLVFTAALIIWLQNKILNKGRFQIIAGKALDLSK